jgi:hypothetical protein
LTNRFFRALGTVALCAFVFAGSALSADGGSGASLSVTRTDLVLLVGGAAVIVLIGITVRQLLRERGDRHEIPAGRTLLRGESPSVDEREAIGDA